MIERGVNRGNTVRVEGLVNDVLSKGHAPAQNAEYDDTFLNEHDGSLLGPWEEDALKVILSTQVVFTPQWCEFRFPVSAVEPGPLGLRTS